MRWRWLPTCGWLLRRLDSRRSKLPGHREIRFRLVEAEVLGPDASRQKLPQRRIALRDSFQYRLDRLGDALASPFRSCRRAAIASTEPYGAREFLRQRVDLLLRALG